MAALSHRLGACLNSTFETQQCYVYGARFANLLNLCSVALPIGFDEKRMPVSMQIVGRAFAEPLILRIGHAYQQDSDWHRQRPAGWDLADKAVA
ncbi:Glutamyl-tRNA(Gln) amidotransferase subunit A [compost metagenome]